MVGIMGGERACCLELEPIGTHESGHLVLEVVSNLDLVGGSGAPPAEAYLSLYTCSAQGPPGSVLEAIEAIYNDIERSL